jgi:CubicO group peptidase (beta-lactamase class C family)
MTGTPLPRTTPETGGIASLAILEFLDAIDARNLELHSLMLLRRGQVLAEGWWAPYTPPRRHMLYSLSKSFLSTAAGLAISEGSFALDDSVVKFFPEEAPTVISDNLAAMQVRHLLSMSTGHAEDKTGILRNDPDGNWVRAFLAEPVEYEPGTHFCYNSAATYMVSAILHKTTGSTALDFLEPRLLAPLGITDAVWETDPQGISVGGWGLSIRTEDIARFGELHRQRGVWHEQEIVPADWVERATRTQVPNGNQPDSDWQQGYGYQFWRCRNGAYRADGAFGQFCVVMPNQEAVFVTTAKVSDLQAVLDILWDKLLPAMTSHPLPPDDAARERLQERLSGLSLPAPEGQSRTGTADIVNGRTYRFAQNDQGIVSIKPAFTDDSVTLTVEDPAGAHTVTAGLGEWRTGTTTLFQSSIVRSLPSEGASVRDGQPCAAYAAWTGGRRSLRLCLIETPFTPPSSVTLSVTTVSALRFRAG